MKEILLAILGGGNLLLFIKFLIERYDQKHGLRGEVLTLKKDGIRTQLLLLILMMPTEKQEILRVAEYYFREPPKGLGGNWYMTSIFNKWLETNKIAKPEWFDKRGDDNEK